MEPLATSIQQAALDAAHSVLACAGDSSRPIGLIGLCFGGLVAYECARVLRSSGRPVESLTIFDAPFGYSNTDTLGDLDDDEFEQAALTRGLLPKWGLTNRSAGEMLRRRLQADVRAQSRYRWSNAPALVANRVTCVAGRRLTAVECETWRGAGDRLEVISPEASPRCWLEDDPSAVAAIIKQSYDGFRRVGSA